MIAKTVHVYLGKVAESICNDFNALPLAAGTSRKDLLHDLLQEIRKAIISNVSRASQNKPEHLSGVPDESFSQANGISENVTAKSKYYYTSLTNRRTKQEAINKSYVDKSKVTQADIANNNLIIILVIVKKANFQVHAHAS